MLLHELPGYHPARNTPLGSIGAECRNLKSDGMIWRPVKTWKISRNTYNQLGDAWTDYCHFRIQD